MEVVSTLPLQFQRRPDAVPPTTVVYPSLSYEGIAQGYAAFSTNTGKSSHVTRLAKLTRYYLGHQSGGRFANWAYNNTEAQKDFGYRSMALSFQAAKTLTEEYYGRPISKKYYLGCSTAGRQGLVEAQRYPEDFDGIVSVSCLCPPSHPLNMKVRRSSDLPPTRSRNWRHGISDKHSKSSPSTALDGSPSRFGR